MTTTRLYRAADDDNVVGCASFATTREVAEAYLANPGFGGATLWQADVEIDDATLLDLADMDDNDSIAAVLELIGRTTHPGAIGVDEWIPRICYEMREAGIEWVRVRESYPQDTITYIFVGEDDPEMIEVE